MTTTDKTLTDAEILSFLASQNYACLFIITNGQRVSFGPGEEQWHRDLSDATDEQRVALCEKVSRQMRRGA